MPKKYVPKTKASKDINLLRQPSFIVEVEDENKLRSVCREAIEKARDRFGPEIGEGRNRICFRISPTEVIKIPLNETGFHANFYEANSWDEQPEFLARCNFDDSLGKELGIAVLRMEYVEHVGWSEKPDWTWGIDGGQVGRTVDGRLVAYDWDHC